MPLSTHYDVIISLGFHCATASQLEKRRLRRGSLPFDWILQSNPDFLDDVSHFISTDFTDFLGHEDLTPVPSLPEEEFTAYKSTKYEITFFHDFKGNIFSSNQSANKKFFNQVKDKYERRIKRFFEYLNNSENVLLAFTHNQDVKETSLLNLQKY